MDNKKKIGGCLVLGCGGAIVSFALFLGGILLVVTTAMKSSDAYQMAMKRAESSPAVVEAIGTPIEPGFMTTGSIQTSAGGGEADMSVPLSGPKGDGTLYVVAQKIAGEWTFSTLVFEGPAGERVDLMETPTGAQPANP